MNPINWLKNLFSGQHHVSSEFDLLAEGQKLEDDFAELLNEDYRYFVSNKVDDRQVYIFYVDSYQEAAAKLAGPIQEASLVSRLEVKDITRPVLG